MNTKEISTHSLKRKITLLKITRDPFSIFWMQQKFYLGINQEVKKLIPVVLFFFLGVKFFGSVSWYHVKNLLNLIQTYRKWNAFISTELVTKKYFWHNQEVFTELLAEFNIRIKVFEKETFSVTSFHLYFRF